MKKFFTLLAIAAMMVSCSTEKLNEIKLNLSEGENYAQNMSTSMEMVQNFQGQKMNIDVNVNANFNNKVIKVENGEYTLESNFELMEMDMKNPMMNMSFSSEKMDSTNEMTSTISKVLKGMKEGKFTMVITEFGEIKSVEGLEEMMTKAIEAIPDVTPQVMSQINQQLTKSFGEEAMINNLTPSMNIYKTGIVKVGDTWTEENKMESTIPLNVNTTYTVKEIKSDAFIIEGVSELTLANSMLNSGQKMDLTGDMTSSYEIDRVSGWANRVEINQDLVLTTTVVQGEEVQEIPMTIKSKTLITNN